MSIGSLDIEEFKESYLITLEQDLGMIESLLLKLENLGEEAYKKNLAEIFRKVHSNKGSSGTYEFYMLTVIFHKFQDLLGKHENISDTKEFARLGLKLVEITKNCIHDYQNKSQEIEKYITMIEDFSIENKELSGKILLVEPTKSIKKIFEKLATDYKLELTTLSNGVTALNRLLHERFDVVFASAGLDDLDGESLLKGVRVMKGVNDKASLALIAASDHKIDSSMKIDFLEKNSEFIDTIEKYLQTKLNKPTSKEKLSDFKFKNIVFVEDDLMIQKIISRIFSIVPGTKLTLSENLDSSLDVIGKESPDLIVLDYFLKDCVGPDILKKLNEQNGFIDTPVLFMTSSPEKIELENMKELGNVKGIIEKPIKARALLDEINRIV